MPFDPNNPFGPPPQEDMRAQILASIKQRMDPVLAPDTSELEDSANSSRGMSSLARMGTLLGGALLGQKTNGDNQFSKDRDADAASSMAQALEAKRMAAEGDKRREELRNQLSTRFVDDENLRARNKEEREYKAGEAKTKREQDLEDQAALFKQQKELAGMRARDDGAARADAKILIENDKNQQKLGKDLAPLQETFTALGEVEAALGGPLEEFSYDKSGNAMRGGKKTDLPGVNIPGVGSTTFFSQEARNLDDTMARVFNQTLKLRSGAAVTDNELKRLRAEFSAGKFNTEAEKIKALQDVKRLLKDSFTNAEAKYNPDVAGEYKQRGGMTAEGVVAPGRPGDAQQAAPGLTPDEQAELDALEKQFGN